LKYAAADPLAEKSQANAGAASATEAVLAVMVEQLLYHLVTQMVQIQQLCPMQ
jgi:hypothetical protein